MKKISFVIVFIIPFFLFSQTENLKLFNKNNSPLSINKITSIVTDNNNVSWVGTLNGLFKFDGLSWKKTTLNDSKLPSNKMLCIEFINDIIYIGTDEGLVVINNNEWRVYNTGNSKLPSNKIKQIKKGAQGALWIATSKGLVKHTKGFETILSQELRGIKNDNFITLAIDEENKKWIGTNTGLYSFKKGVWRIYTTKNSLLPDNHIWSIVIDNENKVWIGTKKGIASYTDLNNEWNLYNKKNTPLKTNIIKSLSFDDYDRLWVGTQKGVFTFDGDEWVKHKIGRYKKEIYNIFIDVNDNKWISTKQALYIYNQEGVEFKYNKNR